MLQAIGYGPPGSFRIKSVWFISLVRSIWSIGSIVSSRLLRPLPLDWGRILVSLDLLPLDMSNNKSYYHTKSRIKGRIYGRPGDPCNQSENYRYLEP